MTHMPEGKKWKQPSDQEKRKRLSRVILDLQKPTGSEEQRERRKNILAQAKKRKGLQRLMKEKPIFHEEDESAETSITIEPGWEDMKDSEEYQKMVQDPTAFFEGASNIDRGKETMETLPTGESIEELLDKGYDVSKVKIVNFGDKKVVVKRVEKEKSEHPTEEFELAKKIAELGIPTPQTVGVVEDKGNTYLLFEYLEHTKSVYEMSINRHDQMLEVDNVLYKPVGSFENLKLEKEAQEARVYDMLKLIFHSLHVYGLDIKFYDFNSIKEKKAYSDVVNRCKQLTNMEVTRDMFEQWLRYLAAEEYDKALAVFEGEHKEPDIELSVRTASQTVDIISGGRNNPLPDPTQKFIQNVLDSKSGGLIPQTCIKQSLKVLS